MSYKYSYHFHNRSHQNTNHFHRYCTKPTELIVQSLSANACDVSKTLRDMISTKKYFLREHRYDPSEIYSDEFEDELKNIPDPKQEPMKCLEQFLNVLDEFGPWCADRAALNLIAQIEKSKIKTPYERHYLLLCLVSTTLIQIRAFCEHIFQRIPNDKECIEKYSSPKARRLLDILRQFKPERTPDESDTKAKMCETKSNDATKQLVGNDEQTEQLVKSTDATEVSNSETRDQKPVEKVTLVNSPIFIKGKGNHPVGGKKTKTGFVRLPRQYNSNYQNDPNALCGLLLCNSVFTAKVLFSYIYEMTKHDPDLEYLSVQYTGDRVADPLTESKQFELEHRKQEEVLKRFRTHSCNLLIGTSVLEEGIELPKCNLVIRWDSPTTYRSYVQCKGRARAQRAFHVIMVATNATNEVLCRKRVSNEVHRSLCLACEQGQCSPTEKVGSLENDSDNSLDANSDNAKQIVDNNIIAMEEETTAIVQRIAQYMQIERLLLKKCSNQEPSYKELVDADFYTDFIRPYKPMKSEDPNTPFVSLATAVVLVNKYCAKLPSDTFTKLTPLWRCCRTTRGDKYYYQYTVRLPINSPVKQDIYVS